MSVRVESVRGKSTFFEAGDEILSIDSRYVEDQLDVVFMTQGEGSALFKIRRKDGRILKRRLPAGHFEDAGLIFEEMKFTTCRSNCIFCFVDQMPFGLRRSLYVKDDDYRLSFLFGNYVTLNDLGDREIKKIIEMNLSPLFISVHAVDESVRERLFGRPMRHDLLQVMGGLAKEGITMHAQVVLVPGLNDGPVLDRTVGSLFSLHPSCRSAAIVPVGLTEHRGGLTPIRRVSEAEARALVDWAETKRKGFLEKTGGDHFLHLSDEFYLIADRALPAESSYDGFPQLANGVGMCRLFLRTIRKDIERIRRRKYNGIRMTVVTGMLGGRFLRRYILPLILERLPELELKLVVARNLLFGRPVGVSGLLSGSDIIDAVRRSGGVQGCLVIPPNALNHEGFMIDDKKPRDLERELGARVLVPEESFLESRVVKMCEGDT